jgi:hypothetical protein
VSAPFSLAPPRPVEPPPVAAAVATAPAPAAPLGRVVG